MHDIRLIRENPESFDAGLARRGLPPRAAELLALDAERREAITQLQTDQADRKSLSQRFGQLKAKGEAIPDDLTAALDRLKIALPEGEARERALQAQLDEQLAAIPNLPADDVPMGVDEHGNVEEKRWGTPRSFDFAPKEHADLGPALGMDFEGGAALSGARFTVLRGQMARLHRALGQFMLDRQTLVNGYTEMAPPLLVKDEALFGTGQLPKFKQDLFQTARRVLFDDVVDHFLNEFGPGWDDKKLRNWAENEATKLFKEVRNPQERLWLIPTAEVSLTNLVREQILDAGTLPMRMTALTQCFRSEAGSAGRDTRGFIRQHQFEKVELVAIAAPEESEAEHERMVTAAEDILEALELPYRRMLLCTGDMGFGARKTWDLEVWLPGQNSYREISSVSNCGDFQARRMNARFRPEGEKATRFVHTLNGSGLAVGRTLVAVLENGQQADGSVNLPAAIQPYMGGVERLTPA